MLVMSVVTAHADDAKSLFEEGRELAKQQKWAEACDKFQKSLALDPAPGTKLNLGDCLEKQGQLRKGWLMFEEAARDFDRQNDTVRAKFAHERASAASAKLATLVIKLPAPEQAGLAVRIGDRAATPQPEIVERVDPGPLAVTVTATGKEPFKTWVTPAAGRTTVVDVPVLSDARVGGSEPPVWQPVGEAPPDSGRRKRVIIAIGLGATGGLALLASGVVGFVAKSEYDSAFDDDLCTNPPDGSRPICSPEGQSKIYAAGTKADIATGLAIAGVALGAAAVIVYVTAPKERGIAVAPTATASSMGVSLTGSF